MKSQTPSFALQKQNALTKPDKSNAQKIDPKIKPLCDKINSNKNLYTTSSCSGRITIIPSTTKKLPQAFLYKTHNKTTLQEIQKTITPLNHSTNTLLWLRTEPAALHIATKTLPQAQALLSKIRNLGWKKSGIISTKNKTIIEAFAPETLITPITQNLPEPHLNLLVQESNKKLASTWQKISTLEKIF